MAGRNRFNKNEQEELDKKRKLGKKELQKTLRVFRFVLPYKGYFALGMVFLIISTLTTLAFPMLAGKITNVAVGDTDEFFKSVNQVALIFVVFIVAQAVASFFRVYLFSIVTQKTMADIRAQLYNKIISLPIPFFEKNRIGELVSRINTDVSQLETMLSFGLAELFRQIATLLIGVTIIFVTSPELALVMISTFPLMIIAAIFFGRFIRKLSKKVQDNLATANVIVEETLQGINVVKAFANELFETRRYRKSLKEVVNTALKESFYRGFFISFIILALFGGIALVFWYGATLVENEELAIGDLLTFILYTVFVGGSLGGMSDLYGQVQKTIGASERVLDIMEEASEVEVNEQAPTVEPVLNGLIQYKEVGFAYPTRPDVQVLSDISFEVKTGDKVALVGHSGAGKSTIIQLLIKFYEIQKGEILIDGQNIQHLDTHLLRKHTAIVPQEVILFGGTIRENIAYGKPTATEEEIRTAAAQANALTFIEGFPDKFDTIVGERGIKLSGGQRQRIAIARAILRNPTILILDEATSSLDAESERLVQEALDELMKGRTTIIIAHRLATIRKVNRIYVINQGKIVEAGTHESLLQNETGIYNSLVKLQLEVSD